MKNPGKWNGSGQEAIKAISAGIHWFNNFEEEINLLNVFPVPDGDTGKNMKNTLKSIRRELLKADKSSVSNVLDTAVRGSLMGAKGCSGIIISLLFQGFAEKLTDKDHITMLDFIEALRGASHKAWNGISNPVNGTILSIADAVVKSAENSTRQNKTFQEAFENILIDSRKALDKTREQLDVLKEAGVVDAGGLGLVYFIEGFVRYIKGMPIVTKKAKRRIIPVTLKREFSSKTRFCLEFILEKCPLTTDSLHELINSSGDSLIIGYITSGMYKVHLHTNDPDDVLDTVRKSGKPTRVKIDDMKKQHRDFLRLNDEKNSDSNG